MARRAAAAVAEELDQDTIPSLEDLAQDPAPAPVRRERAPRKAAPRKAAGNRGKIPTRTSTGRIQSKAEVRQKVATEVETWLNLAVGSWQMVDEECAGLMYEQTRTGEERLQVVCDRVTSMLCRNDTVARYVAESGIIGDAVVLLTALLPVAKAVYANHGPNGYGHRSREEVKGEWATQYPAYTGTGHAA